MYNNNFKIFICATEQSGDNIGYNLITEILKVNNNVRFYGVGGSKMNQKLHSHIYSLKDFKSIGIFEIFFSLKRYYKMIKSLVNHILNNNYDLIITIDSPDFNYPLINKLRKNRYNNKILHIVAPSVWAWRGYRAKKFSKIYDELIVLFDFEVKYFSKYNLKTTFIGHPIYYIKSYKNIYLKKNNIAFLPGSRLGEINKLFPYFTAAYKFLLKNSPNYNIFIPTLPHLKNEITKRVKHWKMKVIISTNIDDIENNYILTSRALVCSGTASLELAKRNIPQLIIYKLNFFTELIAKKFVKVKYANIINIIENKMIIPELTNSNLNESIFLHQFDNLIHNQKSNSLQINNVNESLKKFYISKPPFILAADRVISYLN